MKAADALHRGFNLLIVTILELAGAAFGTVGFTETDTPDKIDDFGLLAIRITDGVLGALETAGSPHR